MKQTTTLILLLSGVTLFGLIALALKPRSVTQESAVSLAEPVSPLTAPTPTASPVFDDHVVVAPSIEEFKQWTPTPTWTPFPTFTPWPTPTRRPGPTTTPFPTRSPASDARGTIFYVVQEPRVGELVMGTDHDPGLRTSLHQFSVGPLAEKLAETAPISVEQLHAYYDITPSPDGRFLLLLLPSMPGGAPHILERETGRIWSLAPDKAPYSGKFLGWHPDSRRILFFNNREQLVLFDVLTLEPTILAYALGTVQGAAISPDGQNIIYSDSLLTEPFRTQDALWLSSTAGSDARPLLVLGGSSYVFDWSPDGRHILYMGGPGIEHATEDQYRMLGPLWLIQPDGQNPRPLSGSFIAGAGYEPAWSPDSQWLVYTGLDDDADYGCVPKRKRDQIDWPTCQFVGAGVYAENVQSGELRRLASGNNPTWSPDGTRVAFLSNQSGTIEIWTVRVDGSDLRQLTNDGTVKNEFVWLPESEVGQ